MVLADWLRPDPASLVAAPGLIDCLTAALLALIWFAVLWAGLTSQLWNTWEALARLVAADPGDAGSAGRRFNAASKGTPSYLDFLQYLA